MIKKFEQYSINEKLENWELSSKIEKIIDSNIKEIPYEGTEVDKYGLKGDILELIYELCPDYKPNFHQNDEDDCWRGF